MIEQRMKLMPNYKMPNWLEPPSPKPAPQVTGMSKKNQTSKKTLDKPTKSVYNIYNDGRELYDLSTKYNPGGWFPGYVKTNLANLIARRDLIEKEVWKGLNLPKPILAGGAIRDIVTGKKPRDYDFFINFDNEEQCYAGIDEFVIHMDANWELVEKGPDEQDYDTGKDNFKDVYGVYNSGTSQFIFGVWDYGPDNDPTCRFDLSTSRAWLDGDNIRFHDDFLETLATRQIKKYVTDNDYTNVRHDRLFYSMFGEVSYRDPEVTSAYNLLRQLEERRVEI